METVLAIPDLHCPFQHRDALAFLVAVAERWSPTKVVCLGDEVDFHAVSDYPSDPDGRSAGDEHLAALRALKGIYKEFPDVSVCESNHTIRPYKKAARYGLPQEFLKDYRELLSAPSGWSWKQSHTIDGVTYKHGDGYAGANAARFAAERSMASAVIGHVHAFAGVQYVASPTKTIFGMNAGCLIDSDQYAFAYARYMDRRPVLGCGVVQRGVPHFIPLQQTPRGRWNRKISFPG